MLRLPSYTDGVSELSGVLSANTGLACTRIPEIVSQLSRILTATSTASSSFPLHLLFSPASPRPTLFNQPCRLSPAQHAAGTSSKTRELDNAKAGLRRRTINKGYVRCTYQESAGCLSACIPQVLSFFSLFQTGVSATSLASC